MFSYAKSLFLISLKSEFQLMFCGMLLDLSMTVRKGDYLPLLFSLLFFGGLYFGSGPLELLLCIAPLT